MPTGVYKRTKEHGEIISRALKKINHQPPHFSGENSSNWKGGKILREGYIYIKSLKHPFSGKQGYIAEHRLVMERHLGRFLKLEETVHHKNGVKTDNRIENLELFSSRGQHTKLAHPEVANGNKIRNSKCFMA